MPWGSISHWDPAVSLLRESNCPLVPWRFRVFVMVVLLALPLVKVRVSAEVTFLVRL